MSGEESLLLPASSTLAGLLREPPPWQRHLGFVVTAGNLARRGGVVTPQVSCREVVTMFITHPDQHAVTVLDPHGTPVGLLRRLEVLARASSRFFLELNGNRACTLLMDRYPVVFDIDTSIDRMTEVVSALRESHLIDGFIITEGGRFFGVGRFGDLLKAVNDLQLANARHANPLTMLPGNAVIDGHVERMLAGSAPFTVAYFDLDNFKPFNDVYGYRQGDDVIRLCARLIQEACDPTRDFLGHVGGDDFIAVMTSPDWEERIRRVLARFDEAVPGLVRLDHLAAGGYHTTDRSGQLAFHPLTSLSAGVVVVVPGEYGFHAEVAERAAEAKKQAKKKPGSSYFVERRRY